MTEIRVEYIGDTRKLRDDEAASKLDKFQQKASDLGNKLTVGVTLPLLGAATAAGKLASDFGEARDFTRDVFKDQADQVIAWSDTLLDRYGVGADEALNFANITGNLLASTGTTGQKSVDLIGEAMGRIGDVASQTNSSVQQVNEAYQAGLKGNFERLDNFGVVIDAATVKQKALELGLADSTKEITQQDEQLAFHALFMERSATAQGNFARTSDSSANKTRVLTEKAEKLGREFGEKLLPAATRLLGWATEQIDRFSRLDARTQNLILAAVGLAAALGPLLKILSAGITVVRGLSAAMAFLAANPVVLVIAAVAALAAGLVIAYKRSETFRRIVDGVFRKVAEIVGKVVVAVIDKIRGWLDFWGKALEGMLRGLARFVGVFNPRWRDALNRAADKVADFRENTNRQLDRIKKATIEATTDPARKTVRDFQEWLKGRHFGPLKLPAQVLIQKFSAGDGLGLLGTGGGSLLGISESAAVAKLYRSIGSPGDVISGYRPGARTLSGNLSYHARGRALDFTPIKSVAQLLYTAFRGHIKELISPWPELGVLNGRRWRFSDAVQAQHDGRTNVRHIHLAAERGALLREPTVLLAGETARARAGGGEIVSPVAMMAATFERVLAEFVGGGQPLYATINVVVDGRIVDSRVERVTAAQAARASTRAWKG